VGATKFTWGGGANLLLESHSCFFDKSMCFDHRVSAGIQDHLPSPDFVLKL
jgi:hypothetical protein